MRQYTPTAKQIKLLKRLAKILFELIDNEQSAEELFKLFQLVSEAKIIFDKAENYLHPDLGLELAEFVSLKEDSITQAHKPELGLKEETKNIRKKLLEKCLISFKPAIFYRNINRTASVKTLCICKHK